MGFIDLIIKLSNTKFARKFQYEPYIIKSVEYVNPGKEDTILVLYKETDYLKSLMMQYAKSENYDSFDVSKEFELNRKFDKIVLFFSINDTTKKHMETILSHIKNNGELYNIFYLNSSKFFEWTLRLTDRDILKDMKKENNILENSGFIQTDELKLPKFYITITKYKPR